MHYKPAPLDTSRVKLPQEIDLMIERLAKNTHDTWASQRILEGWTYGPMRDDVRKQHPNLVPFEELPDNDKEVDRQTAIEALKSIILLGFELQPSGALVDSDDLNAASELANTLAQTRKTGDELRELLSIWQGRDENSLQWRTSLKVYQEIGERLIELGAPALAKEVAQTARQITAVQGLDAVSVRPWEQDRQLRLILSMALIRTNSLDLAIKELRRLLSELDEDQNAKLLEEVIGNLARAYKDRAIDSATEDERDVNLRESLTLYEDAYARTGRYWTGINVAALACLLGEVNRGQTVAAAVHQDCTTRLKQLSSESKDSESFWLLATLAESELILGNVERAGEYYARAFEGCRKSHGQIMSARRHAKLLLANGGHDMELVDNWLPLPRVLVFSGHMPDRIHETPRFPIGSEQLAKDAIRKWISRCGDVIGFASAAAGGDILFLETLQEMGYETRIVIPCESELFATESVHPFGAQWYQRYQAVLEAATMVIATSRHRIRGVSYSYTNELLLGLAKIKSRELGTNCRGLAVWDGEPGGSGGTASAVTRWQSHGLPIESYNPSLAMDIQPVSPTESALFESRREEAEVRGILFADAVNYSHLTEEQVLLFVEHFLTPIANLIHDRYVGKKLSHTHLGDGFFLVFDSAEDAGNCALDIRDFVTSNVGEGWAQLGLPRELNIRISVHAGPIFQVADPFEPSSDKPSYAGNHIVRAARLEPMTPHGEVFASDAFAAMYELSGDSSFVCEYAKLVEFAKRFGTFPAYILRRSNPKLSRY